MKDLGTFLQEMRRVEGKVIKITIKWIKWQIEYLFSKDYVCGGWLLGRHSISSPILQFLHLLVKLLISNRWLPLSGVLSAYLWRNFMFFFLILLILHQCHLKSMRRLGDKIEPTVSYLPLKYRFLPLAPTWWLVPKLFNSTHWNYWCSKAILSWHCYLNSLCWFIVVLKCYSFQLGDLWTLEYIIIFPNLSWRKPCLPLKHQYRWNNLKEKLELKFDSWRYYLG
jgi:hypothetical protein